MGMDLAQAPSTMLKMLNKNRGTFSEVAVRALGSIGLGALFILILSVADSVRAQNLEGDTGFAPGQSGEQIFAFPQDIFVNGYPLTPGTTTPYRAEGALTADIELQLKNSSDPDNFCQVYRPEDVVVDKRKVKRFKIPDPKFLRCYSLWESVDKSIASDSSLKIIFGDRSVLPDTERWFAPKRNWSVLATNTTWTESIEREWQDFVRAMGQGLENRVCDSVDSCLISSANTMPDKQDDDHLYEVHYSDCADFPYYLRAYFAYKKKLPFSFVMEVAPNPIPDPVLLLDAFGQPLPPEKQPKVETQPIDARGFVDLRYTKEGNFPVRRINVPNSAGAQREFHETMRKMMDYTSSATFRMYKANPELSGGTLPDFYPPTISRESIKPGTVFYDASGHVGVVYDVTSNGEVMMMDAHPDNSVTRKSLNREFKRSKPVHGSGFKNWRPFSLDPSTITLDKRNPDLIQRARIIWSQDEEIQDWSDEQYFGNLMDTSGDWKLGKFVVDNRPVSFVDYTRIQLANGVYKLNPAFEFKKEIIGLCSSLQDRVSAVQIAIDKSIAAKDHPGQYPKNIFGASGEWESYSTPGRDLRLRTKVLEINELAKEFMTKWLTKDPYIDYKGTNLKADMIRAYHEVNSSCRIDYVNSKNQPVKLSLGAALARLPRLSFDPYFCPENRWGATTRAEKSVCADNQEKIEWYELTQFFRNLNERRTDEAHDFTLDDLRRFNQDPNRNVWNSNQYNLLKMIEAL
jgi:hypothetical protein